MTESYSRYVYPATSLSWGKTSTGYFASGIFAMHITYPDTEYGDTIEDWEAGVNTTDWRQGVTILIRTPLASSTKTIAEAKNVIAIDLKQQKADHGSASFTYDLGTEEATRFIAAKINSRRIKMQGERDLTKYLRARYVRQSLPEKYKINSAIYRSATEIELDITTQDKHGFPSELTKDFVLRVEAGSGSPTKYVTAGDYQDPTLRYVRQGNASQTARILLTFSSGPTFVGSPVNGDTLENVFTLVGEPPKHTVLLSWDLNTPNTNDGYWSAANGGPIVQGMGSIGVHRLVAKPMDGGNMGIPALNYDSRSGITALAHANAHGFNRFSIEGLNSCNMASIPPPDRNSIQPTVQGITTLHPDTESNLSFNVLKIEPLEYGTEVYVDTDKSDLQLENGPYEQSFTSTNTDVYTPVSAYGTHLKNVGNTSIHIKHGLNDSSEKSYARPFRITSQTNNERVIGLQISNEEMVFENIPLVDDLGNELVLEGGSPFGTIIRDFKVQNAREDSNTGDMVVGPSSPRDVVSPNLQIQLPNQDEIPGGIFVRSGHDRVQAWSNQTWGMGGLTAPNPRLSGDAEANNEASQFETHDRSLIFHCQRILHNKLDTIYGLDLSVQYGEVPSGTTRLFSSHRMSDHAERGSLLTQTNNGVATGNPFPHHRIRFGRQGHSFVMPLCHRGTPMSMRRQLHRSHGSAYSLMFEAESEYKHFGFGNSNTTNSATVFELDTLDVKSASTTYDTGSFAADGLPLDELKGLRLYDVDGAYTSATHRSIPDYLFAPGQEHTNVEGTPQYVSFAETGINGSISTGSATKLTLQGGSFTVRNRYNTGSEFMVNGFFLNNYLAMGGRPEPIKRVAIDGTGNWFLRGFHEGVIRPRVATELATIPPLLHHDPELLNASATPKANHVTVPATSFTKQTDTYEDLALTKARNTITGCEPDAFLCTWLAEYSHPAFFGTMREHFMSFRYREAGMPRSLNYPSTRGLLLRNFSVDGHYGTEGSPATSLPFERIYVAQWLQNYGYNGLNAGGHGNIDGLRAVGAVLMGHTTRREAHGTIQLYNQNGTKRYSRGEGIGDSLNPNVSIGVVKGIDLDSDLEDLNVQYFVLNPHVGIDISRRLPIRSWGFRTSSNAKNMLAGDPTEATTGNTYAITESGRFDGGTHDSMDDVPTNSAFSNEANILYTGNGLERSVPVGFVANDFTTEAHPFERNVRQSNDLIKEQEEQIGIGAKLGITQNGMLSPTSMSAGSWDYELDDNRPDILPINNPVLWLKADSLTLNDGDAISSWTDSSPNAFEFTQGTASARPTYIKSNSAVNNKPVIDCDGNDYLSLPFDAKLNSVEMTVFVVGFVDSDDGNIHGLVESRASSPVARSGFNMYARMDTNNNYEFWAGGNATWITTATNTNTAVGGKADILTGKIYGGDGSGSTATVEIYHNGYLDGSTTGSFYRADGGDYRIGNVPATFYLNGKIAEVIQYDRQLTASEQYEVEAYLSKKYAISISTSASSSHTGHLQEVDTRPLNKGTDPFIDLVQKSGSPTYAQQDSVGAMITSTGNRFGHGSDFYHLRGNALHTNAHAINETRGNLVYPPNGYSSVVAPSASSTITEAKPDMISEITDTRQIQAHTQPRLGLIMEVESERKENKNVDYAVTGTRAISLHTDLMLGRQFPVLPSHSINTYWATSGFSVDGVGSASTKPDFKVKPTWSPDSNNAKGAIAISNDTTRTDYKTHALDSWAVRGVSELPAWGGVYILRKTYLNRNEDSEVLRTEVDDNTGYATTSHPSRRYVDYIVRPVRPLKLFGFASDLMQDGWTLGPRCSITGNYAFQPFSRDKRYGVFEMNYSRGVNGVEPITSAGSSFTMKYPDANEYDITWHLIPSANMLQFAKSDAHKIDNEGNYNTQIEARYSQSPIVGGGEPIYQSETRYEITTGVMGDYARQVKKGKINQSKESMRIFPRVVVEVNKGGGVYSVDDASVLPATGKLFALEHTGSLTYSGITDDDITIASGTLTDSVGVVVSDYTGLTLYYTDVTSSTGVLNDARSPLVKQVISPTFVDNGIIAMKIESQAWYYYNNELDSVNKTTLSYRGLLHYEPSDFIMLSQQPFTIFNGNNQGIIRNKNNLEGVYVDHRKLSPTFSPSYIIDSRNIYWRVAEIIQEQENTLMVFKDMSEQSLVDSGMVVGDVLSGQLGFIGIRTTDAALHLLNDAGGNNFGITITKSNDYESNVKEVEAYLNAHPMLRQINDHSIKYVSRDTRGLNTMEVMRNLSQMDNRQIVNEKNGSIVYTKNVLVETGIRIGIENGVEAVSVSKLYDSPNEIVIVGDVIAGNEIVFIRVQDSEKIRQASAEGEEGVVKTLRQQIPGLKNISEARKLAKALLSRSENGAPLIKMMGLVNATSVSAGEVIDVNLSVQGVVGKFVVFEAEHNYHTLKTNLVIAQYEKGIEGILADIKTNTVNTSGISNSSGDADIKNNLSLSSSVNIISVHRILVRNINQTGFIIGAKYKNGLGKIGVREDNKRAFPLGMSKSRNYVVK